MDETIAAEARRLSQATGMPMASAERRLLAAEFRKAIDDAQTLDEAKAILGRIVDALPL